MMPGNPQECRQQAHECLHLAEQAASHEARQEYASLASTWIQLANIFESDDALLKGLSEAGLNVVPLKPRHHIKLRASKHPGTKIRELGF